jgi:hypothetical protein
MALFLQVPAVPEEIPVEIKSFGEAMLSLYNTTSEFHTDLLSEGVVGDIFESVKKLIMSIINTVMKVLRFLREKLTAALSWIVGKSVSVPVAVIAYWQNTLSACDAALLDLTSNIHGDWADFNTLRNIHDQKIREPFNAIPKSGGATKIFSKDDMSKLINLASETVDLSKQAAEIYKNELQELEAAKGKIPDDEYQTEFKVLHAKCIFMQFIVTNCVGVIQSIAHHGKQTVEAF